MPNFDGIYLEKKYGVLWAILCPQAVRCLAFVCFPPSTDLGRRLRGRWVFMRRPPSRWPMSFSPGYENSLGVKEHTQHFDFLNILGFCTKYGKMSSILSLLPSKMLGSSPPLGTSLFLSDGFLSRYTISCSHMDPVVEETVLSNSRPQVFQVN